MENPIVEKIKKLFAMAQRATNNDGSSNEQEASSAMAKAQELLAKYNLDLRTIQDSVKRAAGGEAVDAKREKTQINRSAMYRWQRDFWRQLAEANYCFHWIVDAYAKTNRGDNRRVKRHVILGSEANVAAVTIMGEYLTETIETLLPYENKERLSKAAISWREGCAERLIERIKAKMENMKQEGVKTEGIMSTALAVRDMAQAEYAANYDAAHGKGAYARHLAYEADWQAGREERTARWNKQAEEAAAKLAAEREKETPAQRAKREEKERRQAERDERRYRNQQWKEDTRLDYSAYKAGSRKANDINLDSQLNEKPAPKGVL